MTQEDLKKEDELVEELRRRVKGTMKQKLYEDDHIFKRFLRARNHDINAATAMLKNHIKWRDQHLVDSMEDDFVPHEFLESEYITISRIEKDLEGTPVTYLHVGHLDMKGLLKTVKYNDMHQYIVNHIMTDMRTTRKCTKQSTHLMDKVFFIFNFDGFSLATATHKQTIEFILNLVSMYEANFPEIVKKAYVINASNYFFLLWAIVKPFLTAQTVRKIKVFGKDGWKEELRNELNSDDLPEFLGGNRTDPDGDPMCKNLIRFGGVIPESYYSYANQTIVAKIPGAKRLTVARSAKEEVTLCVSLPGHVLHWEFVVKSRDISFSVLYVDESGDKIVVIPPRMIETTQATESGMCQCKKSGQYIIEFDNTYSWWFAKEIYYTAEVAKPPSQVS